MDPLESKKQSLFLGNIIKIIERRLADESKGLKIAIKYFQDANESMNDMRKLLVFSREQGKSVSEDSYSLKTAFNLINKELASFYNESADTKETIRRDVIEPLEIFTSNYSASFNNFMKQENVVYEELVSVRKGAEKARASYIKSAGELELAQQGLFNVINMSKISVGEYSQTIKEKKQSVIKQKQKTEELMSKYLNLLNNTNKVIEEKAKENEKIAEAMLQLDEGRIEMLKLVFEKFVRYIEELGNTFIARAKSARSAIKSIDALDDIKVFVSKNENQPLSFLLIPLDYEKYNYRNPYLEKANLMEEVGKKRLKNDNEDSDDIRLAYEQAIISLIEDKPLLLEEKTKLIEHLHKKKGRKVFSELLATITEPVFVSSKESFKNIGQLINYMLNIYLMEQEYDYEALLAVLNTSKNIYSIIDGKNKFLCSLIESNEIWKDIERWKGAIELSIRKQTLEFDKPNKGIVNRFKNAFGQVFTSPDQEEKKENSRIAANVISGILSKYATLLGMFHIDSEEAKTILREFAFKYKLDSVRMCDVELSLKSLQPLSLNSIEQVCGDAGIKRLSKYKKNEKVLLLALAIPYIENKETLRNVLLLNTEIYKEIKNTVFKYVLKLYSLPMNTRAQIWMQLLDIKSCTADYKYHLTNSSSLCRIIDLIKLDVKRSFSKSKIVEPQAVINVLCAYASYNTTVGYCQGMHLIAGLICLMFKDQELSFKGLIQLIDKHEMKELFVQDVPLLKRYLFQMDRLIYLYYPELMDHLKAEGIECCLYASPWFITLFTTFVSYSNDELPSSVLLKIWDEFLLHGWKVIFKVGLFLLSEVKDKLMTLRFEEIMMTLGKASNEVISHDEAAGNKLIETLRKKTVSKGVLKELKKEYEETIREYIKS